MVLKLALDSCVVMDMIRGSVGGFDSALRSNPASLVLCDVVLKELKRKGYDTGKVRSALSRSGKDIEIFCIDADEKDFADSVTARFEWCHKPDNQILALCRLRGFILITRDRKLLTACKFMGVQAFRPKQVDLIW